MAGEERCPFCAVQPGDDALVSSNRRVFVIEDANPKAEKHLLVVPWRHIESLNGATTNDLAALFYKAQQVGIELGGEYRLVVNVGAGGKQEIPHVHVHVLAGPEVIEPGFARSVH